MRPFLFFATLLAAASTTIEAAAATNDSPTSDNRVSLATKIVG